MISLQHVRLIAHTIKCTGSDLFARLESGKISFSEQSGKSSVHGLALACLTQAVLCIHNVIQLSCTQQSSAELVWLQLISEHIFPRRCGFEYSNYPCAHHRYGHLLKYSWKLCSITSYDFYVLVLINYAYICLHLIAHLCKDMCMTWP